MITGKDLIERGYKPSVWFKEALEYINTHNLEGKELDVYLQHVSPTIIEPFETHKPFFLNIEAENDMERRNIELVTQSMELLLKTPTMVTGAVMPDACPSGEIGHIPVGGIAVAKNAIHPSLHSADICCSMMMTSIGFISPKKVL
ncbi:MAG: RNA-splicing ligase RtcB, partial [Bacteroidota bacterium]